MFRLNRQIISVFMSFESNEQTITKVYCPVRARVRKVRTHVLKALAGTDAGTITLKNSSAVAMTGGQISLPASTAVNNNASSAVTDNNTVAADDYFTITSAKTTAGGKVQVFVEIQL